MAASKESTSYTNSAYGINGGADTFAPDLYAYWRFNGDAEDAKGNVDLTTVNSPGYTTGLVFAQAIQMAGASSQYARNTTANLSPSVIGPDSIFSVHVWVNFASAPRIQFIWIGGSGSNAASHWGLLRTDGTPNKLFGAISNGTTSTSGTSAVAMSTGAWVSIWFWHEADGVPRFMIDDRADESGGTMTGSLNETAGTYVSFSSLPLFATTGPVAYWPNKVFSRTERLAYYNSGAGVPIAL